MSTILFALTAAASVVLFTVAVQFRLKKASRAQLKELVLRPNCLLTRYPIAFVSGKKTIFRLFDHWNQIPMFLREHGYEVFVIEPAFSKTKSSSQSVAEALSILNEKCHVIADSSLAKEMEFAAREVKSENLVSLTIVRNPHKKRFALSTKTRTKLNIDQLRPLEKALEVFELPEKNLRPSFLVRTLITAHNAALFGKQMAVDAVETGAAGLDFRFLDLAVSLAERDAAWSE